MHHQHATSDVLYSFLSSFFFPNTHDIDHNRLNWMKRIIRKILFPKSTCTKSFREKSNKSWLITRILFLLSFQRGMYNPFILEVAFQFILYRYLNLSFKLAAACKKDQWRVIDKTNLSTNFFFHIGKPMCFLSSRICEKLNFQNFHAYREPNETFNYVLWVTLRKTNWTVREIITGTKESTLFLTYFLDWNSVND